VDHHVLWDTLQTDINPLIKLVEEKMAWEALFLR
jgi:hypothetical protein